MDVFEAISDRKCASIQIHPRRMKILNESSRPDDAPRALKEIVKELPG